MKFPKWVIAIVALVLIGALVGFGSRFGGVYYEDTNGDLNYSLQTITDEDIIKRDTQSKGLVVNSDANWNESYMSTSFSGVESIYFKELNGESTRITIDYLTVKKGNFKMAVVVNEQIVHEFNINEREQSFSLQDVKGELWLVVAGEAAECDFDFNVI